jgi:hypothetical protein
MGGIALSYQTHKIKGAKILLILENKAVPKKWRYLEDLNGVKNVVIDSDFEGKRPTPSVVRFHYIV